MVQAAAVFPILPGKKEAARKLAKTVAGPKWKDYVAGQRRYKVDKETWFLQPSAQGDMFIYYAEGKDIAKAFDDWAASKDSFDVWLKNQIKEITGIDFSKPSGEPWPEQLLKYGY